jgi:hypothetical protein
MIDPMTALAGHAASAISMVKKASKVANDSRFSLAPMLGKMFDAKSTSY